MNVLNATTVRTPLTGGRIWAVRAAWGAVLALALTVFVVSLPVRAEELRLAPEVGTPRTLYQLRPADLPTLEGFGWTLPQYALYITASEFVFGSGFLLASLVIAWRKSNEWLPLLVSAFLACYGVSALYNTDALIKAVPEWRTPVYMLYAIAYGSLVVLLLIFPTGQFVPRWGRWLALIWLIWAALWVLLQNTPVNIYTWPSSRRVLLYLVFFGAGIGAQIYRFRRVSTPAQRQQTKWILLGLAGAFIGFALIAMPPILYPSIYTPSAWSLSYTMISSPIFVGSGLLIPLSTVIALLRYRLWEADGLVNRSLILAVLTVGLAVVFFLSLFAVQQIFTAITGSDQAVVPVGVSMLLIGVLFNPARQALQRLLDRRLYQMDLETLDPLLSPDATPGSYSGRTFGNYRIGELLGRGGMGEVYRGEHLTLRRTVAIKMLSLHLIEDPVARARFEREAQTVAGLRHPNIVTMYDVGVADGTYYMVMEYVAGQELADYLEDHGRMPLDLTCALLEDVAGALDYAHSQGLVHRDVKPSNVMLQKLTTARPDQPQHRPFRAILMDFGIAKMVSEGTGVTQTGMLGTLAYIAPEQIIAAKRATARADIYALGAMAFHMLTGDLPFAGDTPAAMVFGHLQEPVPDPRDWVPSLPEMTSYAILRAMAKDPDDRFETAGEFVKALRG